MTHISYLNNQERVSLSYYHIYKIVSVTGQWKRSKVELLLAATSVRTYMHCYFNLSATATSPQRQRTLKRVRSACDVRLSKTRRNTRAATTSSSLACFSDVESAHSAIHKRNTQPMLIRITNNGVQPQQLSLKILEKQLHKGREKQSLKFRD